MEIYKENAFFQAATNVKKLGAYYTDPDHCRRIGGLFDFDSASEICVLEPSIGDGTAVYTVTGGRKHCHIYGVELNEDTCRPLKDDPRFSGILNEDFLSGVKISHGAFSFCFANPPYGEHQSEKKRLEMLFVEKLTPYLKKGAYLALVIPFGVFRKEKYLRMLLARYEVKDFYRFDDKEYEKYYQIVVILKKKPSGLGYQRAVFEALRDRTQDIKTFPYLPEPDDVKVRLEIPESKDQALEYFTTIQFHAEEAAAQIGCSGLFKEIGTYLFQHAYTGCDLNHPIVPVSKEISYLLAVTGGGQGYAGSKEDRTLHLQRGVAKRVDQDSLVKDEEGNAKKVVTSSYTEIKLNIIENSGRILQL